MTAESTPAHKITARTVTYAGPLGEDRIRADCVCGDGVEGPSNEFGQHIVAAWILQHAGPPKPARRR